MHFFEIITDKVNAAIAWLKKTFAPVGRVFSKIFAGIMTAWSFVVKLRKIFLSVPVALAAVWLAAKNMDRLPDQVGLNLQADGSFEYILSREWACGIPMLLTLICIVLMCCSKRVLTPWVVSVITLIVPIFIWVTNIFPA